MLTTIPPIYVYMNRINNRLFFKTKDGYKLELLRPEAMKLFACTKKLTDKTKKGVKVPSLAVVEVISVQCNLVNNQYQQNFEQIYTFPPNKSYAYFVK